MDFCGSNKVIGDRVRASEFARPNAGCYSERRLLNRGILLVLITLLLPIYTPLTYPIY